MTDDETFGKIKSVELTVRIFNAQCEKNAKDWD